MVCCNGSCFICKSNLYTQHQGTLPTVLLHFQQCFCEALPEKLYIE